ncbi:MAG: hypothetical protein HYT48_00855 [Candidatus Vogelbacteria bacterium]|nr:hypothetical protein [Candidatus Vogelbacteria bacterium]
MDRHKIITANFVIFTPPPPPPPPPTTQPTITVLSPNGGNYKIGDPLVVSWSSSNLVTNAKAGALFFHLSDANGTLSSLCLLGSAPKTQTGSVTFTLPSTICADLHPLATGNYKIHVFAEDLTHSSEWIADDFSNNYFTITSAIDGPVSPTNIAASDGTSASGIVVTWTRSTDDPGSGTNFYYKVWRSTSQNATYNPIFVIYSPQAPSFTDTTVAAGTTYWYKVSAGSIVNNRGTDGPLVGPDSGYRAGETTPDTTPPTTAITAPTGGQTVSGTLTISATASDPVVTGQTTSGVTKVEFYRGATLLGTDTASPFTYSWDTTTAVNGNYTLQTKAFDGAGNVGSSATVSVTVNNTVTDTTPDSFSFTDQANVALNTVITSNIVTITGLNVSASVSITGGSYSINGGTHTTAAGTIANNQTVAVRHNSSANYSAAVHTTLTIGGVSGTFTSTTQTSPSQTGVPVPPTNVSASDGSSTGGIVVTWTRSIDDPGQGLDFYYKVWRSTSQNGTYNPIFVIYSPQAPSHTDTTVSAGTTYWYKVSAGRIVNNRGTDGPSAGPDSGYRAGTTSNASILSQIANILQGLQSLLNNLR